MSALELIKRKGSRRSATPSIVYNPSQFDGNNLYRTPSLTSFHHLPAEVPFSPSTHLPPRSFTRRSLPTPRSLPVVYPHSIAYALHQASSFAFESSPVILCL